MCELIEVRLALTGCEGGRGRDCGRDCSVLSEGQTMVYCESSGGCAEQFGGAMSVGAGHEVMLAVFTQEMGQG